MGESVHHLKDAKARKYQDPTRRASTAALRESLPEWARLGEDIRAAGFEAPEWVRIGALEKIVPMDLLRTLIGRPELVTYIRELHWAECELVHVRGSLQALVLEGTWRTPHKKDAGGGVMLGEVKWNAEGAASLSQS